MAKKKSSKAKTEYTEHMANWESKKEKAVDQSLIENEKSSSIESDFAKHPKFAKFNIIKGEG